MSDHDVDETVEGLKSLNASSVSSDDDSLNEEDVERILSVEKQLLTVYDRQSLLFETQQVPPPLEEEVIVLPIHKPHAYPCQDTRRRLPSDPSKWPQAPVMLRPSPKGDTKIRGIRFSGSTEYQHFKGFCAGCILPVNTGAEPPGKSLVIDFESKHFVGTLLMRIREAPAIADHEQSSTSYFDGKKRRFQAIVKGRFKSPLQMSKCVTGQTFDRPAGKLPARWIITSFIKFVSTLAPQMQVTLEGDQPKFLTPLVATAHTVLEQDLPNTEPVSSSTTSSKTKISKGDLEKLENYNIYAGSRNIEDAVEEPPANDESSVMKHINSFDNSTKSVSHRQAARKKAYNKNFASGDEEPKFDTSKEYTFEFYQHLLRFGDDLAIDMGRAIGKVSLAPATNGQPIKFMSAYVEESLWSFDIWHASLYPYAKQAEGKK